MEAELKVLVDTDVLIKAYRGSSSKIQNLNSLKGKYCISVITALELVAGAKSIKQLASLNKILKVYAIFQINEDISAKAFQLYRKYILKHNLKIPTALSRQLLFNIICNFTQTIEKTLTL